MSKIEQPGDKKKGHLTLLRPSRTLTPKEYNALSFQERLGMVRMAEGRAKYKLIIEAADGAELTQSLPAQDLYVLIKEMGMEDVSELIAWATTEQVTTFIDLDSWNKDQIDGKTAMKWLVLAMDEKEEGVMQRLREIDFPLLVLMFQQFLTVVHGPELLLDEDAMFERDAGEKIYRVNFHDPESAKLIDGILDCLNRWDQAFYMQLLEGTRSEMPTQLEEIAYQERIVRLKDDGFPDPAEAMEIYARINLQGFDPAAYDRSARSRSADEVSPGFVLTAGRARNLLAQVLAAGVSDDSAWELTFLLNKAMVADRVESWEPSQVRAELEMVYGYLNLALEELCGDDVAAAVALFDRTYLLALFRFGFNLTISLQRRAKELRDSGIGPYLDGPYAALVAALSAGKPRYFAGLEEGGRSADTRLFTNQREVRQSDQWLSEIEVQRRLFENRFGFDLPKPENLDLSGCQPADPELVTLSDFFLTALANRLCGRSFLPLPILRQELGSLHALITENGRLDENLRRETLGWLAELEPQAEAFGAFCLEIWDEEFCPLDPALLDPRYIGGLLMRLE